MHHCTTALNLCVWGVLDQMVQSRLHFMAHCSSKGILFYNLKALISTTHPSGLMAVNRKLIPKGEPKEITDANERKSKANFIPPKLDRFTPYRCEGPHLNRGSKGVVENTLCIQRVLSIINPKQSIQPQSGQ